MRSRLLLIFVVGCVGILHTFSANAEKGPYMAAFAPDKKVMVMNEQYTSQANNPQGLYNNTFLYSRDYGTTWQYSAYPADNGTYNLCGPKTAGRDVYAIKYLGSDDTVKLFLSLGTSGVICGSGSGEQWLMANPPRDAIIKDEYRPFYDATYGNGTFVAVGGLGLAMFSTDPQNKWQYSSNPDVFHAYSLNAVAFGQGKFVVVGNDSNVWYSPDGQTWTQSSGLSGHANLEMVTFVQEANGGTGQFVAVGGDATIWYSSNGEQWTIATMSDTSETYFTDVAYGNGTYVAIGNDNTIARSSDGGKTWVADTYALSFDLGGVDILNHPHAVTFYNNNFVVVTANYAPGYQTGNIFYSEDKGVTWHMASVVYGNNQTGYCEGYNPTGCVNYLAAVVNTDQGMVAVPYGSGASLAVAPAYILRAPTTGTYWFALCDLGLGNLDGGCFQSLKGSTSK
jgi:photosystem II stability/assembly factor-like uncharacterized protein